jgi:hypothetical protein
VNAFRIYQILGYCALLCGVLAMLSVYRISWLLPGMCASFLGFVFAVSQLLIQHKHGLTQYKWPLAYIAMFLSSLPVLFVLFVVFKMQK